MRAKYLKLVQLLPEQFTHADAQLAKFADYAAPHEEWLAGQLQQQQENRPELANEQAPAPKQVLEEQFPAMLAPNKSSHVTHSVSHVAGWQATPQRSQASQGTCSCSQGSTAGHPGGGRSRARACACCRQCSPAPDTCRHASRC